MSRTTHGASEPVDACRWYAGLILGALRGEDKETLLAPRYAPAAGLWERSPLAPAIDGIARGSFREKAPPEIRGTGYVVQSMEAALWTFHRSDSFEEGALLAVNLGDDADTTGPVAQAVALFPGPRYGAA
jgi:ADP-ribosylglycohydrolase